MNGRSTGPHRCIDCIFLRGYDANGGDKELSQKKRDILKNGNIEDIPSRLRCSREIWNQRLILESCDQEKQYHLIKEVRKNLFEEERGDYCFFYPYREQVLINGAIELEKRAQENSQLKGEIHRTNKGLRIAAWGLIFSAIFSLGSLVLEIFDLVN